MQNPKTEGLVAAPFTPMLPDGSLNLDIIEQYAECLHQNDLEKCLRLDDGRYDVLFGRDELLLSAQRLGARGAVGSTYNFASPLYLSLIEAFDQADQQRAQELQELACRMIEGLVECGSCPIATFKKWMSEVAVECGKTRLPLTSPTEVQFMKLRSDLEALKLQRWLSRPVVAS